MLRCQTRPITISAEPSWKAFVSAANLAAVLRGAHVGGLGPANGCHRLGVKARLPLSLELS